MRWILGFIAVAVLVGVAATLTVPAQTVTLDEATLKLLPPETQGVAVIDVAGLRNAPLFNDLVLQKLPPLPRELNEFAEATGVVPQRDIDSVTIGKIGERSTVLLIRARFDKFKVEQFIKDKADHINTETYLGRVIYKFDGADTDRSGGAAMIDDRIVVGNLPAIKQVIDRLAAPSQSVLDNAELLAHIRTIESGNQIWAAGKCDFGDILAGHAAPDKVGEMTSALTGGTYQMRIDQDVHVKATGVFNSAEMAKAANDTLRGLLAMGKLQFAQQDKLARLLDGISVENSADKLTVTVNASGDLIRQLQEMRALPRLAR